MSVGVGGRPGGQIGARTVHVPGDELAYHFGPIALSRSFTELIPQLLSDPYGSVRRVGVGVLLGHTAQRSRGHPRRQLDRLPWISTEGKIWISTKRIDAKWEDAKSTTCIRSDRVSRKYANIATAIWRHDEFRSLTREAQLTYLMLVSQPDISAAGVLSLNLTRWASNSQGTNPAMVLVALQELQSKRFVVVDQHTEEVLVRSFVRWDGGYTNPKRLPSIERACTDVISERIRQTLGGEVSRLGLHRLSDSLSAATPHNTSSGNAFPQENSLSDRVSGSDGVVVTEVSNYSTTHNPKTTAPTALRAPDESATDTQRSRLITNAYYETEPMCNWNAVNGIVVKAIRTGRWTDQQIHDALIRMASDGRPVTAASLRIELDGMPAFKRAVDRPSVTDARVNTALDVGARLQERIDRKEITA